MTLTVIIFGAAVRPDGNPSGAMRQRVQAALAFAAGREAVRFMPTGGQGRFGPPEADVMAASLREAGVPPEHIVPERTGTNTIRSVLACARLLRGEAGPVYVATSAYHMTRCVALLRLAGVPAHRCPAPPVPASSKGFRRWYWRLREIPALPVDSGLLLWMRMVGRL